MPSFYAVIVNSGASGQSVNREQTIQHRSGRRLFAEALAE
jgi:hypothetical protein